MANYNIEDIAFGMSKQPYTQASAALLLCPIWNLQYHSESATRVAGSCLPHPLSAVSTTSPL